MVIAGQAAGQLPSPLLPGLYPPLMHIHIAEWKRIKKARIKKRRETSHRAATEYEEIVNNVHRD